MSEKIELLPCPFCGSHDVEVQGKPAILDPLDSVLCNECTADAPYPVWNTRALLSQPAAQEQAIPAMQATEGGRNPRYEGLFDGETDAERESRLKAAAQAQGEVNRAGGKLVRQLPERTSSSD